MESLQQSTSDDVPSNWQEEMDVQQTGVVPTSSGSRLLKRSHSPSVTEGNKKYAGDKRLVIKPVVNVVTHFTENMIVSERQAQNLDACAPGVDLEKIANVLQHEGKKLTDSITVYLDAPLSETARVYPGIQKLNIGIIRPIAVKILNYSSKKKREAQNLFKLNPHVNVVSIMDSDEVPGFVKTIYIAMEQCQTMSLELYYKKRQADDMPFNPKQSLVFARQIIEGINHIHKNNIIHRDLKPSSFLFSLDGKNLKTVDFGLSKELEQGLSTMSVSEGSIGTDGFRAPETYLKDEITQVADIFSLGIVLFYIWSFGSHPFGEDSAIWSYNIKSGKPPDLCGLLVPDKENAKDLLEKMLCKEQSHRLTIADVLNHDYIEQGVHKTLRCGYSEIWRGQVDGRMSMNDCVLFKKSSMPRMGVEISDMKWQIHIVPAVSMNSLKASIGGEANGYLGISISAHDKLMRMMEPQNYRMAWINLHSSADKTTNAFIIIRPPGYEELIGIFIANPKQFHQQYKDQILNELQKSSEIGDGIDDYSKSTTNIDSGIGSSTSDSASEITISDVTSETPSCSKEKSVVEIVTLGMAQLKDTISEHFKHVPQLLELGRTCMENGASFKEHSRKYDKANDCWTVSGIAHPKSDEKPHNTKITISKSTIWSSCCEHENENPPCHHIAMALLHIQQNSSDNGNRENQRFASSVFFTLPPHPNIYFPSDTSLDKPACRLSEKTLGDFVQMAPRSNKSTELVIDLLRQLAVVCYKIHDNHYYFVDLNPDKIRLSNDEKSIKINGLDLRHANDTDHDVGEKRLRKNDIILLGGIIHFALHDDESKFDFNDLNKSRRSCKRLANSFVTNLTAWQALTKQMLRKSSSCITLAKEVVEHECWKDPVVSSYSERLTLGRKSLHKCHKLCHNGAVRKVFDNSREEYVAVKVIPNFRRENKEEIDNLKIASEHENVVRYHRYGIWEYEGKPAIHIVMELCDRDTLKDKICKGSAPKTTEEAINIMFQIASGLNFIHEQGILHRDLKPHNILCKKGHYKISDFGLSKLLPPGESNAPQNVANLGTDGWRAPETSSSEAKSRKHSDVFSFGLLFYYTLTRGGHPFGDMDSDCVAVQSRINDKQRQNDRSFGLALNENDYSVIEDLLTKVLEYNPTSRPSMSWVLRHPVFWTVDEKWKFYGCIMEYRDLFHKIGSKKKQVDHWPEFDNVRGSVYGSRVFSDASTNRSDWLDPIRVLKCDEAYGPKKVNNLKEDPLRKQVRGGFKTTSVISLIRYIRNRKVHRNEAIRDGDFRKLTEEDVWDMFSKRFPYLLLYTYYKIQSLLNDNQNGDFIRLRNAMMNFSVSSPAISVFKH